MHYLLYQSAIDNQHSLLASFERGANQIIKEARGRWIEYAPTNADIPLTLGIDGSFNTIKYQGIELWAATSLAVGPDGSIKINAEPEIGFERNPDPQGTMQRLELDVCKKATGIANLVLMDGSLVATLAAEGADQNVTGLAKQSSDRIVFVSKTSNGNTEFESMGSQAGDIYYYNKASTKMGFSKIRKMRTDSGCTISSTYVRLAESAPLVHIEMFGSVTESDVHELIDKLYGQSVRGYPHALRSAHEQCTVALDDIKKIETIVGTSNIIGSRDVL